MTLLQTVVLAVVQGITELLPVSSSGHLILTSKLLSIDSISTFTLTSLHLGTTIAIILFNWKFLFTNINSKIKLYSYIVVATIPAAIIGVLFGDVIEGYLRGTFVVATMLIVVGAIMLYVDRKFVKVGVKEEVKLEDITFKQTLVEGLAQSIALVPGVSRSGITTIAGMFSGISQYTAIRLSFILGIPILVGSFTYEMFKTENSLNLLTQTNSLVAIIITFVAGYMSLWFLDKMSKTRFLRYFGIYRIVVGVLILILFI
ncbi:hypothetical protein HYV12_02605 [Candidatus Dojkabacteria bacterium]|nr:hypothetical protein [Candidatus Dojkabacteria bacterium]